VPLDQVDGPALTDAARQLLGDPNARAQARRLQQLYAAVDGPGAAADAIAELLSTTARARR
jgi:UDP:flavonoid glycosyltransferase YjiC (YdhE family)